MTLQHQDLRVGWGKTLGEHRRDADGQARETPEIANVVTFMLSSQASYMTGSSVFVDGGWSAI
jgi:NAD(P)-dependent dehydrogenase (short-subunit alcohol dehydrogenase family)